jgi:sorting nexin-8
MSLFGDDDDVPSRPKAQHSSSSLFDDDPKPTGNSLFADDLQGDDSPWGFNPTPKKQKGSVVKSLLPASDVPDSYIDAFDRVLESGERAGSGISVAEVKKLLASSGLPGDKEAKILGIVSQPEQESAGVGRNEFNVLYALIGLAQDGYDVSELSLDSVDERKKSKMLPASV